MAIQLSKAYKLDSTVPVNMCAVSFALCSPPSCLLAAYLFDKYPADKVLKVANAISFFGAMFRFFSVTSNESPFWPILVGTILMASVSSIFLNA